MPVLIYDISKKLGLENKEVLSKAKELGIAGARVASSSLDKITAEYLEQQLVLANPQLAAAPPPTPALVVSQTAPAAQPGGVITAPELEAPKPLETAPAGQTPVLAPPSPVISITAGPQIISQPAHAAEPLAPAAAVPEPAPVVEMPPKPPPPPPGPRV